MPELHQPTYPSTTNYPPATTTESTAVTGGGITRNAQNSFKISDEMLQASLKCAIEDKIRRQLNDVFAQAQVHNSLSTH